MRRITKRLINTDDDLLDFGLQLGFARDEIFQMKTNNPNSIETAAWGLACEWWESSKIIHDRKPDLLVEAVQAIGKLEIIGQIRDMLPRNRAIEGSRENPQTQVKYVDDLKRVPPVLAPNAIVSMASGKEVTDRDSRVRAATADRSSHEMQNRVTSDTEIGTQSRLEQVEHGKDSETETSWLLWVKEHSLLSAVKSWLSRKTVKGVALP